MTKGTDFEKRLGKCNADSLQAGPWTPESAVEDPEAVRQLHREFLRAGADVMQANDKMISHDMTLHDAI